MKNINKLVALIDGSEYSDSVCEHAAWIANRAEASVELVHVLGPRDNSKEPSNLSGSIGMGARSSLLEELSELDAQAAKLAQKRGRLVLESAKEKLVSLGVAEVTTMLRHGDFVDTVQEFESHGDLIVVGKRGETASAAKAHLGSNLERVVRASHKPILVAARAYKPVERILLAFDGGSSAKKAIKHIAESPVFAGLECRLLTVGNETPMTRQRLDEAAAELKGAGLTVETSIQQGEPDEAIAAYVKAEEVDLLIMGAYGHSRIRNLIIGSTTTEMVRSCKNSVMLFR